MTLKDREETGKKIARLLAENRAGVNDLFAIFDWAKRYLVVTTSPADSKNPEA